MTSPAEKTAALVQTVRGALSAKKATATSVWHALYQPAAPAAKLREKVVLPSKVAPTVEQEKALAELPTLLAAVNWPTVRRALKPAEKRAAIELLAALRQVEALAKETRASLRTTVLNDGDVTLETKQQVNDATPRDKDGHYLVELEGDFEFDTLATSIDRSVTQGSVTISAPALLDRIGEEPDESTITRKEYLAVTEAYRSTSEAALLAYLAKHPERAAAFLGAATLSGGSLSMLEKTKNAS